jgi:hypothetical protein
MSQPCTCGGVMFGDGNAHDPKCACFDAAPPEASHRALREALEEARRLLDRLQRCDALADCADCMTAVESFLAALSTGTETQEPQA